MVARVCAVLVCMLMIGVLVSCGGPKIVGTWKATDEGDVVKFTFNDDGTGVVNNTDSKPEKFKYKIDYSKKPIWLDITPKGEPEVFKLIGEFKTADKIRLAAYVDDSKRPTKFADTEHVKTITFTRSSKH